VQAKLTFGTASQIVPLVFVTNPPGTVSTFSGIWTPQKSGNYNVSVTVVQRSNGNTAFASGTISVL
jgi:hypothetical protein